ncbi:hypothetical protein WJ542_16345 [Paraburkholderia sp. B3]|uniref:hypothetical protein n=1 Tax=Paraburkholderia sp. B3 TaxID=3134791 RepID=UPI0039825A58
MSRNRTNLASALIAVGAIGATAGMLAWRWSQRHRAQRLTYHRELNRWEGEGGSLASAVSGTVETGASTDAASPGPASAPSANGAAGTPWPFPHGNT